MGEVSSFSSPSSSSLAQKKDNAPPTFVFKFNSLCECEGCTKKIKKAVRGAEDFKVDRSANELTVIGKVDPAKVRDNLKKEFLKKEVEIVPPQPKKDAAASNRKPGNKREKKADKEKSNDKKDQDKKLKEKVEIVPTQPKKNAAASNKKPGDKQEKKADKEKSNDRKHQDKKLKENESTKVKRVKEKVERIKVRRVTVIQVEEISQELEARS